jgi:hypothetical protein
MEVTGQFRDPAALPPGKDRRDPLDRRLGGPQSRSGRGGEGKVCILYIHTHTHTHTHLPVPVAKQFKIVFLDLLLTGFVGSNPAPGMDYVLVSVSCSV